MVQQNNYQNQQPQQEAYASQDYSDDDYSGNSNDSSTYGEQEQELIRVIIEVRKDLSNFEHTVLRGQYEHVDTTTGEKGWKRFDDKSKPIINEIGIREIMGRLMGYATPQTILSYFEEDEIYKNLFYFDMSLAELVAKRADYWEMDMETAKAIKDACVEFVQSILFRARKGFTSVNLRSTYQRSEVSRSDTHDSGKRSFLGIPLGGRGK